MQTLSLAAPRLAAVLFVSTATLSCAVACFVALGSAWQLAGLFVAVSLGG